MKTLNSLQKDLISGKTIVSTVVNSSNISTWSYNPNNGNLGILFKKGYLYNYSGVPIGVAYELLQTQIKGESFGKKFRELILNKYTYTRFDSMGDKQYTVAK